MTLPNFLICGAPKAGTTALHHLLKQHPDIYMSREKETDFFQHNYTNGLDWFEQFFSDHHGEKAIGEVSPGNMIHPEAPKRIAEVIPDAQLIFMLRNPIQRAFSQYLYGIYLGMDNPNESFSEMIRDPHHKWGARILELGMYYEQLQRFEQYFQRDRMLILLHEDFSNDPQKILSQIFEFVGVDPSFKPEQKKHNATKYPKNMVVYRTLYAIWNPIKKTLGASYLARTTPIRSMIRDFLYQKQNKGQPKLPRQDQEYLTTIYQESIQNLSAYIQRDLSSWLHLNEMPEG